jgi:hypothetical protein
VSAVRDEPMMLVHVRRILTTPIACRLHVCADCTRILVESVICLDKSLVTEVRLHEPSLFHTQSHVVMEQSGATIWEIAEPDKSNKVVSAAMVDIGGSTQVAE